MPAGRALGYGLIAGAAGIVLLMLAWLATSGAQGGGIVLGLLLLFVLAGPLAGGGWYVLSQQRGEALAEAAFVGKRRILEADRLFRGELAPQLAQLAQRPGLPATRLMEMAADLERKSYHSPDWYDTVALGDADVAVLQRYDDLVWERVRSLRDQPDAGAADAAASVRELQLALDQRRDLLVRGKRAPSAAPSALLRAGTPRRDAAALARLALNDAVSYDDTDFLVEGLARYFADGQSWTLAHLAPSRSGAAERWLYVGPAGLQAAVLQEVPPVRAAAPALTIAGAAVPREASGSATVDVASAAGAARGILVSYDRYGDGRRLGLIERWPDGAVHGYAGPVVGPSDVEVWPAAVPQPQAGS